ncbi:MAG: Gfo/Idh/MocA family oxidoreductase [Anaerolineales bacterium]
MEESLRVGVIGYGYWGPNLTRNFFEIPSSEVVAIVDKKKEQLERAMQKYPRVTLVDDYRELFSMGLDAVVISTPPKTHFPIAFECLSNNLHVLVEKPLALNSEDAEALIKRAKTNNLTLMVGHTFEYNSAVKALKEYIQTGELGDIYYLDTARLNLGLYQRDTNVLWDLAVHDISILLNLLSEKPVSVSAQGMTSVSKDICDVAYLNIIFPNNIIAHVHVSWLDPCKVRRVTVVGSKKMAVFNDLESEGKIKLYDKGVDAPAYTDGFGEFQYNYRSGDITIPSFRFVEPLREECQHFLDSIINKTEPVSSGQSGLAVIKVLEAAERSIKNNGHQETIAW